MLPDREILITKVKELANQTGFAEGSIPESLKERWSPGNLLMASNYAILIVGFAEENSSKSVSDTWMGLQSAVGEMLLTFEKDGMLIDGYLIVALPERPDEALHASIREMELNTSVCRKHVVWPLDTSDKKWDNRLRYVTVLGLPANTGIPNSNLESKKSLPPKAKEVLDLYDKGESYKAILEYITNKSSAD